MTETPKSDTAIPEICRLMEFTRELEASMDAPLEEEHLPRATEQESDDELEYDEQMLDEYASSLLDEFSKSNGYMPFDADNRPSLIVKIDACHETTQASPEVTPRSPSTGNTSDASSKSHFEDSDPFEQLGVHLPVPGPLHIPDTEEIVYHPKSPIPPQIFSSIIAGDFSYFPVAKLTRRITDLWYLPHVTSMPFLLAKNAATYSICSVLEIILRPDISTTRVVAAVKKIAAVEGFSFRQASASYSVLSLTDEAITPTTPLAHSESQQEAIQYVFSETNLDVDMLVTDSTGVWNEVHCEVCLSSEIRQRVLLCCFVRNKSVNTPDALLQKHIINDEFGLTKHMISTLQKLLTSNHMSFSCIYYPDIMPPLVDPPRIDDSTVLLLLGYVHRTMILKFKTHRRDMYSYIDATEAKYNALLSLVQPMYKQHGLAEPFSVSVPREVYLPNKGDTPQTTAAELWEDIQQILNDVLVRHTAEEVVNCLIAQMDTVWNYVTQKKDDELTKKLSLHNAYTVTVVNEYCQHRRRLLWDMIHSHRSKESKLALSYASVFSGYEGEDVIIPSPSKGPPSSASFLAEGSKWFTTTLSNGIQSLMQPPHPPAAITDEPSTPPTPKLIPRSLSRQDSNSSSASEGHAAEVVLYCCTCLVGADPGFVYITSNYISTASRHLATLSKRREVDQLRDLAAIEIEPHRSKITLPSTLVLTFCDARDKKKVVRITPAWVDAAKLKILIEDAKDIVCNLPPGH